MLEESARVLEIAAIAVAVVGVGIIAYSVIARRSIFVLAAGALLGAAALVAPMLLRPPPVDVLIVRGTGDEIAIHRHGDFYGGIYTTADGQEVSIDVERAWGRHVTVLINDSRRLVKVSAYQYSERGFAPGAPTLTSFVLPMEMKVFPRRIFFAGSESDGPPPEITSTEAVDFAEYLSYGRRPYEATVDGDRQALRAALDAPERFKGMALGAR